ncbi:hypothetical protein HVPorG_04242 [Roseomonas mucosa]|nr:hypothetical protein HVPorG_04242 [Roseomonas mucosa]
MESSGRVKMLPKQQAGVGEVSQGKRKPLQADGRHALARQDPASRFLAGPQTRLAFQTAPGI